MSAVQFGIINTIPDAEILPVLGADFSKVGIVTTSADADPDVFPTQTAVRFSSTDPTFVAAAAIGTGHLAAAVNLINQQVGLMGGSVDITAVRVAVGGTEAQTLQNVVDGLAVLRDSPSLVGSTARIIICPGYTHQVTEIGGSVAVTVTPGGGNHGDGVLTEADPPTLAGRKNGVYKVTVTGGAKKGTAAAKAGGNTGSGTMGAVTVDTTAQIGAWRVICGLVASGGGSFSVLRPDGTLDGIAIVGSAYNSANGPSFTIADGTPDFALTDEFVITVAHSVPTNGGAIEVKDPEDVLVATGTVGTPFSNQIAFTLADGNEDFEVGDTWNFAVAITDPTLEANPVIAALPDVLESMLAIAPVDGPDTSRLAGINWRETINNKRIFPVGVQVRVFEDGAAVSRPAASAVAGLFVRVDNAYGGKPFQPIANRAIYGIVGTSRTIGFSDLDGATEGQLMLESDLGIIVRGEMGVDGAIADGGFIFIGTESCAEGDLWSQIHMVRAADYLLVKMNRLTRQFLGRLINVDLVETWVLSLRYIFRDHKAAGEILGYKVDFIPDKNSPENVRLGRLTVTPRFEPAACFRVATHEVMRYRPAVDQLVKDIVARLNVSN